MCAVYKTMATWFSQTGPLAELRCAEVELTVFKCFNFITSLQGPFKRAFHTTILSPPTKMYVAKSSVFANNAITSEKSTVTLKL